jgi:hypothetical protein
MRHTYGWLSCCRAAPSSGYLRTRAQEPRWCVPAGPGRRNGRTALAERMLPVALPKSRDVGFLGVKQQNSRDP